MKLEEKLKILTDCDFSKWRQVQRKNPVKIKEIDNSFHTQGFGNVLSGIRGALDLLSKNPLRIEFLKYIKNSYQFLKECYKRIPFAEIDEKDEDFKFLFDYKDKLNTLGILLNTYFIKFENEKKVSEKSKEYMQIINQIKDMFSKDYREDILKKYGLNNQEIIK